VWVWLHVQKVLCRREGTREALCLLPNPTSAGLHAEVTCYAVEIILTCHVACLTPLGVLARKQWHMYLMCTAHDEAAFGSMLPNQASRSRFVKGVCNAVGHVLVKMGMSHTAVVVMRKENQVGFSPCRKLSVTASESASQPKVQVIRTNRTLSCSYQKRDHMRSPSMCMALTTQLQPLLLAAEHLGSGYCWVSEVAATCWKCCSDDILQLRPQSKVA
jgi:hypothetical protein